MAVKMITDQRLIDRLDSEWWSVKRKWLIDCSPTPELAYIAGAVYGDGCLHFHRNNQQYWVLLSAKDLEFILEFGECIRIINRLRYQPTIRYRKYRKIYHARVTSEELFTFLKDLKSVEELARLYPREFLRGLFDADGGVLSNKITLGQKDKRLIDFAEELLGNLGIKTHILTLLDVGHTKGYFYRLEIYKKESRKFMDGIGFTIKRKQEKLRGWLQS